MFTCGVMLVSTLSAICMAEQVPSATLMSVSPDADRLNVAPKSMVSGELCALVPGLLVHGAGHFYAGDLQRGWTLLGIEAAGLGCIAYGNRGDSDIRSAVALTGVALYFGSEIWDIIFTPEKVKRWNLEHRLQTKGIFQDSLDGTRENAMGFARRFFRCVDIQVVEDSYSIQLRGGMVRIEDDIIPDIRWKYNAMAGLECRMGRFVWETGVEGFQENGFMYVQGGLAVQRLLGGLIIVSVGTPVLSVLGTRGMLEWRWPIVGIFATANRAIYAISGSFPETIYSVGITFGFNLF